MILGFRGDLLDLDWSPDSRFIAVASKDIVARCGLGSRVLSDDGWR